MVFFAHFFRNSEIEKTFVAFFVCGHVFVTGHQERTSLSILLLSGIQKQSTCLCCCLPSERPHDLSVTTSPSPHHFIPSCRRCSRMPLSPPPCQCPCVSPVAYQVLQEIPQPQQLDIEESIGAQSYYISDFHTFFPLLAYHNTFEKL